MGVAEPSKLPEWASVPGVDPVSGESNIVEPSESKKDSGFDFKERPPRQDHNWLFNLIWLWIKHFKSRITGIYTNLDTVVSATAVTPDVEDSDQLRVAILETFDHNFLSGFHIVDWVGDTEIEISKGIVKADSGNNVIDAYNFDWGSPMTKDFGAGSYAFGTGNNGKADGAGLSTSTWYHLFVFRYNDSGTIKVDLCFDDNISGTNLPTNLGKRRIMTLKWDGGDEHYAGFVKVSQLGDHFWTAVDDVTAPTGLTPPPGTFNTGTPRDWISLADSTPKDIDVMLCIRAKGTITNSSVSDELMIRSPIEQVNRNSFNTGIYQWVIDTYQERFWKFITGNDRRLYCGFKDGITPGTKVIVLNLGICGWIDLRGKDWGEGPALNRYYDLTPP